LSDSKTIMENPCSELLLDCLHQDRRCIRTTGLKRLTDEDWVILLALAKVHSVSALLYHRLKSGGFESAVAGWALMELKALYRSNALRNLRLFAELNLIAKAFRLENIPLIALKGAHLAQDVYGDIALRQMSDIDLLVQTRNLSQAADILVKQGYHPYQPYDLEVETVAFHHLPPFLKKRAVAVEIHWGITLPYEHYAVAPDELWQNALPINIAGVDMMGLSSEDLLLHICLHASYQHLFANGLRSLCDIAELAGRYGGTHFWQRVRQRAKDRGWQRGVFVMLRLSKDLVGAAVPENVLRALEPSGLKASIAETAHKLLFAEMVVASNISAEAASVFKRQDFLSRLWEIVRRIFISRVLIARRYSIPPASWRVYLYYPVRLVDLIVRKRRILWRIFRGKPDTVILVERKNTMVKWLNGEELEVRQATTAVEK